MIITKQKLENAYNKHAILNRYDIILQDAVVNHYTFAAP